MMNNKNLGMNMNLNLPMNNLNLNGNINPLIQNNAQNMLEINPNMQYLQPNNLILPINNFPQQGMMNYNPMNQINNAASPQPPMPIFINQNIQNLNNFGNINNIGTINNINNWNNFQNINNINDINNMMMPKFIQNNSNMNLFNEEKNIGKYTCKYEILIENEPEFQIARRLIGSKGSNMKKIITQCKSLGDDEVKLRLRGKGSGYKEGPDNKESEEPLHLCISSKTTEQMEKACSLVDELIEKINKDYKDFCKKKKITPTCTEIAKRADKNNNNHKV